MSELKKTAYLVAAAMAILHNGKRYEQGDKIELTDEEAEKISLYIALDEDEAARQQVEAEAEAEKQRLAAEKAAQEAAEKSVQEAAEKEAKAKAEAEKKAQEAAKKRGQANKDKDEQ